MNSNLFPAGNVNSHWAEKAKPTEEAIQGSPFEMKTETWEWIFINVGDTHIQ